MNKIISNIWIVALGLVMWLAILGIENLITGNTQKMDEVLLEVLKAKYEILQNRAEVQDLESRIIDLQKIHLNKEIK